MTLAIKATDVCRIYASAEREVVALNNLNLAVEMGQFVAVKGKSGSGKTTLLNVLGGLDSPTSGEVEIHGHSLIGMDGATLTTWRQKEIGFIFQAYGLLPTLSAFENVELMLRIAGIPRSERKGRAAEMLAIVGLDSWANQRPFEMSGGQQQRVAIARALAHRPQLILADEATGELDSQTSHEILTLLTKIAREEGVTILLATHDVLVDEYVDKVMHLKDGVLVDGAP